tara:strand:+ start:1595 stop:2119 length:525 start_codon:yes stop_codon:yes gene_type:complete
MDNTLLIYSSKDGQTEKISNFIYEKIKNSNQLKIIKIEFIDQEKLDNYSKIILGASIRYGKHSDKIYNFVKKNLKLLNQKKTAFFSVNVVARKPEKNTPETNPYVIKFLKKTKWNPSLLGVFAGKVDYPSYGFFDKYIIKLIMFMTKGPLDTSKSYEFTDWQKVQVFSDQLDQL